MGRGNVCVSNAYEGLFYIDNDDIHEYRCYDDVTGETKYRKKGELSYEDLTGCHWRYDEDLSQQNWEDAMADFVVAMLAKFPSLTHCDKWIEHDRYALLENKLFYIAIADNEWSTAVMLIQKEHWCYDYSGLQKRHYRAYLDGIRDVLFEQFPELGTYKGCLDIRDDQTVRFREKKQKECLSTSNVLYISIAKARDITLDKEESDLKKLLAYKMTLSEAEEILQTVLDDASLKLVHRIGVIEEYRCFFAESDSQQLDGAEIDDRLAQFLGVKSIEHYAADDGGLIAVVTA